MRPLTASGRRLPVTAHTAHGGRGCPGGRPKCGARKAVFPTLPMAVGPARGVGVSSGWLAMELEASTAVGESSGFLRTDPGTVVTVEQPLAGPARSRTALPGGSQADSECCYWQYPKLPVTFLFFYRSMRRPGAPGRGHSDRT